MNHGEKAKELFLQGYNCAQAVLCAFCGEIGMDMETAARISSSFGGGMGRMREVCGACSGCFMAAGLLWGYDDPKAREEKAAHYARIQQLAQQFREINGAIVCRELLGNPGTSPEPAARTETYYKKRPCAEYVQCAAEILEKMLQEENGPYGGEKE